MQGLQWALVPLLSIGWWSSLNGVVEPIWTSYKVQRQLLEGHKPEEIRLEKLLQLKSAADAFFLFTQKEFASENLVFWLRAQQFSAKAATLAKTHAASAPAHTHTHTHSHNPSASMTASVSATVRTGVEALIEEAKLICQTFIEDHASFPLNISAESSDKVRQCIRKIESSSRDDPSIPSQLATLFADAQAEVMELMEFHSYRRFKQTPEFAELVREYQAMGPALTEADRLKVQVEQAQANDRNFGKGKGKNTVIDMAALRPQTGTSQRQLERLPLMPAPLPGTPDIS